MLKETYKQSHNTLLEALEKNPHPVIIVDPEANLLFYNGKAIDQVIDTEPKVSNLLTIVHNHAKDKMRALLQKVIKEGVAQEDITFQTRLGPHNMGRGLQGSRASTILLYDCKFYNVNGYSRGDLPDRRKHA